MTDQELLKKTIDSIVPADAEAMAEARARQDSRVKVPGSLGRLEDISVRLAGITGRPYGSSVSKQAIIIMSADNGIAETKVASAPQTVTLMQTVNFTKRITGVGSQAAYFGIDILDIDVGVKLPIPAEYSTPDMLTADGSLATLVVDRRIANGTKNFLEEPAMSREEALRAFCVGIEAAKACKAAGKEIIGVGEMGIGNSTTGSCIICALTGAAAPDVVGRGGGLNDEGLAIKTDTVERALDMYGLREMGESPNTGCDFEALIELTRSVGGFDICAMAGAYLGAAALRMPAVVDGFISIAAALVAKALAPDVADYLFTSHRSLESGYAIASRALGIEPMFDLGMKLGEASGCPIAFKIIEAACAVMNGMKSLDEAQVESGYLKQLKDEGAL